MARTPTDSPGSFTVLRRVALTALVFGLCTLAISFAAVAQDDAGVLDPGPRTGFLIRIAGALDPNSEATIRRQVLTALKRAKDAGEWPWLIFELHTISADIYKAEGLASYISGDELASAEELRGARTVAYIPEPITGHAVLLAMACHEIIMHPDASMGNAGEFEIGVAQEIDASVKDRYVRIANRRRTVPVDVALAMLEPRVELLEVQTPQSAELVTRDRLAEMGSPEISRVLKPAGAPGVFTAAQLREWQVVKYLAQDKESMARVLDLPREAVVDDPSLGAEWKTAKFELHGPVNRDRTNQIQNGIEKEIHTKDKNFILIWIDSAGGDADASIALANYLVSLDSTRRRTVAYIPRHALGDAAYVALACDHIIMHPEAVLGGSGDLVIDEDRLQPTVVSLQEIAHQKMRPPALAAAFVDPNVVVHRYTRQGGIQSSYFTEEEVNQLPDAELWQRHEAVKEGKRTLQADGDRAARLGLAYDVVDDFEELKSLYGLEGDPELIEPGWADTLIEALNSPGVAVLLLLIGSIALYAELHSPGIGMGGLIAAVCFVLFFWSSFLGGTAAWFEILLFVLGVICVLLEIFVVPGTGIFGLGGGLLMIFSVVLASQTFIIPRNEYQLSQLRNSILVITSAGVGTVAAAALMRRYLPHTPVFNRMLLAPPSGEELSALARREALAQFDHLLGAKGTAVTPLLPGGKARFGDETVDVVTGGESIDRGQPVEVVKVRGNHVLVRLVS